MRASDQQPSEAALDRYRDRPYPPADDEWRRYAAASARGDRPPAPREGDDGSSSTWLAVTAGVAAGALGVAFLLRERVRDGLDHPRGDAPERTLRQSRDERGLAVEGRTVTIAKPRAEVYAFWRDFSNLAKFLESIESVRSTPGGTEVWTLAGPGDRTVELETRIVDEVQNERVAWRSVEGAAVETHGEVTFRDAPGGRGTEVAANIAWKPPGGEIGRWVMKAFQREPSIQARRELKRLKMLLETGEIATAANRRSDAPAGRALTSAV